MAATWTLYGMACTEMIVQLALAAHLPTIFAERENVEAGGLASYGIDTRENFHVAAGCVDKI